MRVLIQSINSGAHQYINMGYARAFSALGFEVALWNKPISEFDIFDQVNPDIFLGQTYNLTEALIKCIQERPHLKVILRASDRSQFANEVHREFPILVANEKEIQLVNKLRDLTGHNILHNHYPEKSLGKTHEDWIQDGYKVISLLNGADIFVFCNGIYKEELASDICFIGGYLPLKTPSINSNLIPLIEERRLNIKIFGNTGWPTYAYCGYAPEAKLRDILASSKICINLSEQHALKYGYDLNERWFQVGAAKGFCVADYVEGAAELFPDVIFCETSEQFKEQIYYWTQQPKEKREEQALKHYENIIQNHTYLDRVKYIGEILSLETPDINSIKQKAVGDVPWRLLF